MRSQMARLLFHSAVYCALIHTVFTDYEHKEHDNGHYKPYGFGYEIEDGWGNSQYRHEKGSAPWDVRGSYGYKDAWGIHRHVDYVADKWGFRAHIKTNEPGTAPKNPAAVKMDASPDINAHKHVDKYGSNKGGHYSESRLREVIYKPEDIVPMGAEVPESVATPGRSQQQLGTENTY